MAALITLTAALVSAPASAALKIFACEPEWAALAQELGGSHVDVYAATTGLQDPHRIQARPSLIAKYRQADLVVCTGAELEIGWLPALVEKANNPRANPGTPGYLEASRFVSMLEVPASVDRSQGDVHPYGNPHIQTDPRNIALVAKALAERLATLDAAHAVDYRARHADFSARWTSAIQGWEARAKPLAGMKVVSVHRYWPYLYRWLGIEQVATLEPKPGIPPTVSHLEEVLQALMSQPARMIIFAGYQDRRPGDWLAQRASIPVIELPGTVGGAAGADDLFSLFEITVDHLLQAAGKT
ncbi:MAG: metal ABC transporter substrate-binding protein [Nevskiales bacterium]